MRRYEATFIFRNEEESIDRGRKAVAERLEENGIELIKEEDMGERALAYEIENQDRGHYFMYELESSPEKIQAIDRTLLIRDEILKYLVVLKDA